MSLGAFLGRMGWIGRRVEGFVYYFILFGMRWNGSNYPVEDVYGANTNTYLVRMARNSLSHTR